MLTQSNQLIRRCLASILLAGSPLFMAVPLLVTSPQLAAEAQSASAETSAAAKLEAIKQALIDLALGTEVKLESAAYLDASGGLHEASIMSTNTRVRGIRVVTYLQEAGLTTAKIDASMLSDASCPGFRPSIRRQATIRQVLDTTNINPNRLVGGHYYSELLALSEDALVASLAASSGWSVKPEMRYANTYQSFVQGDSADNVPYRFDILLRNRNTNEKIKGAKRKPPYRKFEAGRSAYDWLTQQLPLINRYKRWPAESLDYQLTLIDRATEQPLWSQTLPLDYPKLERGYGKQPLPVEFKRQVQRVTDIFMDQVTERMHCHAQAYQLQPIGDDSNHMAINAGSVAGIKVGDQFLLSDDAHIMDRAVNPAGLNSLALAKVVSVSAHSASLRQLAGPQRAQSDLPNLVAVHL